MPLLTVSGLNTYVKSVLDGDENLGNVMMSAEISDYKNHYQSGHRYMTLKDEDNSIKAVMFSKYASRLGFVPENGVQVIVRGSVSLYTKTGQYQFYIEDMRPVGAGELRTAFDMLKARLEKEGIFSPEHKKPLPEYPKRIGVITSDTGAAIKDISATLARRYPIGEIILCPVYVQGVNAAAALTAAVERIDNMKCADVIIIGRGGGTSEDLSAFNDERLIRAIYACETPIVSGVGHQTDTTLCDFVADAAAATPTAAAELVSPEESEMSDEIKYYYEKIITVFKRNIISQREKLDMLVKSRVMRYPQELISERKKRLEALIAHIKSSYKFFLSDKQKEFSALAAKLDTLSPLKVLARGYSVASKNDKIINSVYQVARGDIINIKFYDGSADCTVTERKSNNV